MTLEGTVFRTAVLLVILVAAAACTWSPSHHVLSSVPRLDDARLLGGFGVALLTIFVPRVSPYTAPLYAFLEGLFLGGISSLFEQNIPGIAMQAVGLTLEF